MREFQTLRKKRKWLYSKWTILALFVVFILGLDSVWNIYQKEKLSKANLDQASLELNTLKERQAALEHSIGRLATPQGLDEEIRNKFSVAKDGEEVAIIVDRARTAATSSPTASTTSPEKSLWQKFLDLF